MPEPAGSLAAAAQQRSFLDVPAMRKGLYEGVRREAQALPPVKNQLHTLQLTDVDYEDDLDEPTYAQRKQAVLGNQSISRRLRGTWVLSDNATGQVLDRKRSTIAQVPVPTDQGTFLLNGVDYMLANQQRLLPGIFTRVKNDGMVEAHVNVLRRGGLSHHYLLEPEKGVFKLGIEQSTVPLLPLLKAMGVKDEEMRQAWGDEVWAANMQADEPRAIAKLAKKLLPSDAPADPDGQRAALAKFFTSMQLDPRVMRRTLGLDAATLEPAAILRATQRMLAVHRGEEDEDDRDELAYQTVLGPEDLFAERMRNATTSMRQLLWKASLRRNLQHVPTNALGRNLQAVLLHSGLGQAAEEVNPLELLNQHGRVTRMGEGAIGSLDAIPDDSRSVQPSYHGYIDSLVTPECYDRQTEVMTLGGWKLWPEVTLADEFACLVDGRLEFHQASRLISSNYCGPLCHAQSEFLNYAVTPNHRMLVRRGVARAAQVIETADLCHNHERHFTTGGHEPWEGCPSKWFLLPACERGGNAQIHVDRVDMDDWAELVGWYLAEGSSVVDLEKGYYRVDLSQSESANPDNCRQIEALLDRLPWRWQRKYDGRGYSITSKQLAVYFKQFGYSGDRWIPAELLLAGRSARQRLFDALTRGEGRLKKKGGWAGRRSDFSTGSWKLAIDCHWLAFSLGVPARITSGKDKRSDRYLESHCVHLHLRTQRELTAGGVYQGRPKYYKAHYEGRVYCAEVPGGLLYVRRQGSTGFWCGNSLRIGVESRFGSGAVKGNDGRIYTTMLSPRTGKSAMVSPEELSEAVVAFPGELDGDGKYVRALRGGRLRYVKRQDVDWVLPHEETAFSPLANLIPMKSGTAGQRISMGARMLTQATALREPEAPLVRNRMPGAQERSYSEEYGKYAGAVHADQPGVVESVTPDGVTVRYRDGSKTHQTHQNLPYNRKSVLHQTAVVRPGDPVEAGQLLARSNFTDDKGAVAVGRNLRVGYLPFQGRNFEDAVVISESAAEKMTSESLYQHQAEWDDHVKKGKNAFVSLFAGRFPRNTLETLDDEGVVKPGTVVRHGDPLVLVARERARTTREVARGKRSSHTDASLLWEHHHPGVVVDVAKNAEGPLVAVKSYMPAREGDKLTGLRGDKGVVSAIVPDDEMPQDAEGRPLEVLVSPVGVDKRKNPSQIVEAVLGKIAARTGKPYNLPDFGGIDDYVEYALEEARKHGVSDLEDVTDPTTGRKIKDVLVGNRYYLRLHHHAESKASSRSFGGYTSDQQPARPGGAVGSSKRLAMMETNALLGHGAYHLLGESRSIKGQQRLDDWANFMAGKSLPTPQVPFVWKKMLEQLRATGVNPTQRGETLQIMALTDRDINQLSEGRELENAETVKPDESLAPIKGGLFDPTLTGGPNGNRWTSIKLSEPMLNPVMEEPARKLLGLTGPAFEAVMKGQQPLQGHTGPAAIQRALAGLNIDEEIRKAETEYNSGRASKRDDALRRLKYLRAAKRMDLHPGEWIWTKAPVLPPAFRPVSRMQGSEQLMADDANYLYKELFDANQNLKEMTGRVDDVGEERLALYQALKAVTGLGDPLTAKNQERRVRGSLQHVFGSGSPKFSMFHRKLFSGSVDMVGRGTVIPDPDLDMDQLGIPERQAWEIYKPFVVRRLVRRGMPPMQAAQLTRDHADVARHELMAEMDERPVYMSRAPVHHKYGVMAFRPQLTRGDVIRVPPLVVKGFGMDYNGDSCLTDLLPVMVRGQLFLGTFEEFIREHLLPGYRESEAVAEFGKQTTVLELQPGQIAVPGVASSSRAGWQEVSHLSIHTSHGPDCYRVTTSRGLDAIFTAHHNFTGLDDQCRIVPVKTSVVRPGDLQPSLIGIDTTVPGLKAKGRPGLPLTFNSGFWLGHFLGDGSLTGREDTVSQASTIPGLLDFLEKAGRSFSRKTPWREGNGTSARWTDTDLFQWLLAETGRGSEHRNLPGWALAAPKRFRIGVLAGWIAAESSRWRDNKQTELANIALARRMCALAASVGVSTTLRPGRPARPSPRTGVAMLPTCIVRINAASFADLKVKWPVAELQRRFQRAVRSRTHQVWDAIPYPKQVADWVSSYLKSCVGGKGRWHSVQGLRQKAAQRSVDISWKARQTAARLGRCTRRLAAALIDACRMRSAGVPEFIVNWVKLADETHLIWSKVERVEKVERPDVTYDFHIPDGETFTIDGFHLTHNTANFHVPFSPEAVEDALRMLPSANLLSSRDFKVHQLPTKDYQAGLYAGTAIQDDKTPERVFATQADMVRAHQRGELKPSSKVIILNP